MTQPTTQNLEIDRFYPYPPVAVWRALTEPSLLERWWAPGDIAPRVGHRFHLDMDNWGHIPCEVLAVEPHERLVYTFGNWTLEWRLVAEGNGTRLLLEHRGFDLDDPTDRFALDRMGPGWRDEVLPLMDEVLTTV
jgi:uncharacterized protein YndB with AHSA1/START domain